MYFSEKLLVAFGLMTSSSSRTVGNDTIIPVVPLHALLASAPDVTLRGVHFEDGNVSPFELFALATLVADSVPKCLFEIGTFNGNTTLQMAENSPHESMLFTLDLPVSKRSTAAPVDPEDVKYIESEVRRNRRYAGTQVAAKVIEFCGDSVNFDFGNALGSRRIDFAFIDGSHSYEYVKSDTEKVFRHLASKATVLWHDYQPFWNGVCLFLNEFHECYPLCHIEGTSLVYLRLGERC
jgi:hypothetical protein